ncbi:hypothetical protein [Streptomyces sp. uw30]|uniref:hypothetical protein n=1 Tax=Streptomyces sp. uw30 TaxID=1828179 RepID=UPI0011CE00CE|nr:hypothetical protein [Streptomyces sp. uw30]
MLLPRTGGEWRSNAPDDGLNLVVPIVGWATPVDGMRRTDGQLAVEPVVLFDNVDEPLITTLADTLWRIWVMPQKRVREGVTLTAAVPDPGTGCGHVDSATPG